MSYDNEYNLPSKSIDFLALTRDYTKADHQYEILMRYIKRFEDELDPNEEVAIRLSSFGQNILLNVTKIAYANPSIITFYGLVDGQHAQLVQHINQLNFMLIAVQQVNPKLPPRRIGFITDSKST